METFSASLAFCAGIHRSPVNSPYKDQWRGALMFSLICACTNGWVNNREADDLRRHRTHYNVTLMSNLHWLVDEVEVVFITIYVFLKWHVLVDWRSTPKEESVRKHGLYSLSGRTSCRQISISLEATRFGFRLFLSLWNLRCTLAACQISEPYHHYNILSRGFETSRDLTVSRPPGLVNRGHGIKLLIHTHIPTHKHKPTELSRIKQEVYLNNSSPLFPRYWPFGQWRGALIFTLICAGDLRRHRTHYDVIVMNSYRLVCNRITMIVLKLLNNSQTNTTKIALNDIFLKIALKTPYYISIWASSRYKDRLSQVWDSHAGNRTVARPSYL